jgi:hypothetical protein
VTFLQGWNRPALLIEAQRSPINSAVFLEVRMRTLVAVSALVLLAACGQQQQAAEPEAPAASGPAMPEWASQYVGQDVAVVLPNGNTNCVGYVDAATVDGAATRVTGWAWDRVNNRAYDRLITVGADRVINGAGTTTTDRSDVVGANPSVTNPRVGYEVISNATSGTLRVGALDTETNTACWVGQITY